MTSEIYRVTGRAKASFIFRAGVSVSVDYVRDGVPARLVFGTRYIDANCDIPVPGDLYVVIEASSASAREAFSWITVGREITSIFSLITNAAAEPINGEMSYDITTGKQRRPFFQRFIPADKVTYSSRTVPVPPSLSVIGLIAASKHRNRIMRAITQYSEALSRWQLGNELLILSHLWMGIEAITKAHLRLFLEKDNYSEEDLANKWGYQSKGGYMERERFLYSQARQRLVCQGDAIHHKIAREVSDAFEHGFADGGKLWGPAGTALIPIARYLRESIFSVAQVLDDDRHILQSIPFSQPRGPGDYEQYVKAELVGDGEVLAAPGYEHPCFDWNYKLASVSLDSETWNFTYSPEHTITARVASGINMSGGSMEIWDAGIFIPFASAPSDDKRVSS